MDIFDLRSKHEINIDCLSQEINYNEVTTDTETLMTKTKWLLIKELNLKWHIATLSHYLERGLVPRSLRWEVAPEYQEEPSVEEENEWAQFFIKKGLELVKFIIQRKQCKLREVQEKLVELQGALAPVKKTNEFHSLRKYPHRTREKGGGD